MRSTGQRGQNEDWPQAAINAVIRHFNQTQSWPALNSAVIRALLVDYEKGDPARFAADSLGKHIYLQH